MLKKEARQITGGLSAPSKMPGPAYNLPAELVIRTALKAAGYTVGHIATQGVWDEDKPKFAHGKWDASRLPHEEIAK